MKKSKHGADGVYRPVWTNKLPTVWVATREGVCHRCKEPVKVGEEAMYVNPWYKKDCIIHKNCPKYDTI